MTSHLKEACDVLADALRSATVSSEQFCRTFYSIGPNDSIPEAADRFRQHQVELWVGHPVQPMN